MKVYFYFVLFLLVFGGLAHYNDFRMREILNVGDDLSATIESPLSKKNNKSKYGIWLLFLFIGFFFIQAFRFYVGTDYLFYFKIDVDWEFVTEKFKNLDEPIAYLLSFIARSIWDHPLANIIMFSLVITGLLFYGLKKYDNNDLLLSLLLYTFIGPFLFSLNGIMQAMALTFIFAFSKKGKKNWILKYIVVIFIAFLIHKSAIMFLPILIISQFKITKYQMAILFGCAFIIPLFYTVGYEFMGIVNFEDKYIVEQINPIRVVVAFAPLILLFFIKDRKRFFEENYFLTNMAVFNAIINLTTMNSAYLNRFSFYSSIYLCGFISKCLNAIPKKPRIIVACVTLVLYFVFFLYEAHNNEMLNSFNWIFPYMYFFE